MSSRNRWINRLAKRSAVAYAAAAAASTLFSTSAWAVTGTWITTSSANYTAPGAWIFATVPGSAQDVANFTAVDLSPGFAQNNIPQTLFVDLTTFVTLGSLVFADTNPATPGAWVLDSTGSSGTLVLDNGTSVPVINVGNLGNLATSSFVQIDVPIIDAGLGKGLIKTGAGELRMTRSNDFGGGTLFINGGTLSVGTFSQIGNIQTTISMGGGTLSLRNNGTFNMSGYQLNVTANSGLYVDNALGSVLTGQNIIDQVGTIDLAGSNVRMSVSGSTNGYGLNIGTLIFQGGGSSFFTDLSSGSVTISNVTASNSGTLTFSGTGNDSGSDLTIVNTIAQGSSTQALSIAYTDSHTLSVGSFGGPPAPTGALTVSGSGTLLITGTDAVIPSATLTVSSGSLDFSNSASLSTVGTILMGASGSSAAYIKVGTGGLALTGPVTYTAGSSTNPSAPGYITGSSGGVLTLSGTITQTFNVGQIITTSSIPGQDLLIDIPVAGSGSVVKTGAGELVLSGSNTFSGTMNISNGTLTSLTRTSGSALDRNSSVGTVIISSGNLRILSNTAVAGSAAAGTLLFTGDLKPAQLIIDASGGGDATLSIGNLGGRLSGSGVLTIIPVTTALNTVEHINVTSYNSTVDPASNHGILAPFIATEKSASNSALDFVSRVGVGAGSNNLTPATYTTFTGSEIGQSAVVQATSNTTVSGFAQIFAIKVGNGAVIDGTGVLQLGDNTRAGIILNDGAQLNESNLLLTAQEIVAWSGGTTSGGSVGSQINLINGPINNLTTGGAQTLNFSSTINLGGNSRTITVGSGTTLLSGNIFSGNLTKSGPGVLLMTGDNPTFNGTLTVAQGTTSIGTGGAGSLGVGSVNTGASATGLGTLQFNLSGTRTITNFMTGQGTILQNSTLGGILVLHSTPASTYSNLAILSGGVQLSADNDIPQAATISVGGGSFDLNGHNQTINALAGGTTSTTTGLITNSSASVKTLTLNPASTINATYSGDIGGTTSTRIVKIGSGTQTLAGNGDYTGGVVISNGTLSAASNTALGHDASVILNNTNGAILRLEANGVTLPASLSISISNGTGTVSVGSISGGANAGTISGPIVGIGTFVIKNQNSGSQLTVGTNSLDTMVNPITGDAGTVLLSSGGIRFFAGGGANVGNPSLNFNLSGTGVISTVAVSTLRLGNLTGGGSNVTITAANGSAIQLGGAGGAQQFSGTINGAVSFSKVGNGTLTLNSRTSTYTGVTNILGGALVLSNATLSGTPAINILSGPLIMTGAASISGNTALNLSESFPFDVTTHQGWSTPANLTVTGTGLIYGAYTHNSGSLIPGGDGAFGSITFNTPDTANVLTFGDVLNSAPGSAGLTLLDFSSLGVVGSGSNDLIKVNGDVALYSDALFRVNNLNPITNFVAGQTYAAILYSGSELTTLDSQVSSAFRGSFSLVDMPNDPNFPGYKLIGVKVVSFSTTPSVSTWTGSITSTWDLNITKNFVDSTGSTTFYQGDSVVFDNSVLGATPTAGNRSINLSNGLYLPGTLTFGNTSNLLSYTVNGPGIIGGGAQVLINGGGTVSITGGGNTYTGGTVVNSGWLVTGGNTGNPNLNGNFGIGSVLLKGGASGQSATLVFAANGNVASDIYTPSGQMANFVGLGSLGTQGKLYGTFNIVNTGGRWDLYSDFQLPTDPATGTLLLNSTGEVRLMRPYAGAGLYINFASGQGVLDTNLFDPLNDQVYIGGLSGPGSGNLRGFNGGNAAWYKAFVIGGANADSTWGGQVSDSFGRAPADGGGQNAAGISNSHGPTAITKTGTATLKLNGQSILMSGDLTVNQGTMIIDDTDPFVGTRDGGGLFMWATKVQVNSGATFQVGSGGADGLGNYIGDGNSSAGTFLQASSTGTGVLWNANNATINVSAGYTVQGNGDGSYTVNTQYGMDPNLTISGSNGKIFGALRVTGGTLSPGDGGSGRYGTLSVIGASNAAILPGDDPNPPFANFGLTLDGGALLFDVGAASADTIAISTLGSGSLAGNGQLQVANNANNKIIVNFNGTSAPAGTKVTLMTYSGLGGGTFTGPSGPQLILNGRGATGTLVAGGGGMQLSITHASSASNIQWASSNGTWDVASWAPGATHNFANLDTASSADYFYQGDNITFNPDAVAGGTVLIPRSVAPAQITVNTHLTGGGSVAYTFAGEGRITGNASLVKNGDGTLTIRTTNDYSGGTTINAGTLEMGASAGSLYFPGMNISATGPFFDGDRQGDVGSGSVTIASGATLAYRATRGAEFNNVITGAGGFVVDQLQGAIRLNTVESYTGGTTVRVGYLSLGVDNAVPSTGSLNILTIVHPTVATNVQGGAGGRFDLNEHSESINELYGNGAYSIIMNEGSLNILNPQTTLSVGSGNFMGAVHQGQEGGGIGTFAQIAIVKFSTGTLTMNYITTPNSNGGTLGTNVTGLSDVKQGMLVIRGITAANGASDATNTASGSYTVRSGATLAGDATIRSSVNVDPGGIVSPGLPDSTVHTGGTLTVNALNLNSSILNFDLRGIDNDQIDVVANNTLTALGTSTININVDPTLITQAGTYKLLDYQGTAITGFGSKFAFNQATNVSNPGIFTYTLQHNTSLTEIDLVVTQPTVTSTWNVASGGSWAVTSNWASVGSLTLAPNNADSVANLTAPASMGVDPTVTVNATVALATLNLSTANGHSFTIKQIQSGSFNFVTSGAPNVGINVSSGNQVINVPTAFNADPVISVASGSTLTLQQSLDAAGQNVTVGGGGMLAVGNIRNTSGFNGTANLHISGNTTVKLSHFTTSNLVNGASKVNTLTIDPGSKLDITNNAMVLDYSDPSTGTALLASTHAMISAGTITSSELGSASFDPNNTHGIGYRDNQGLPLSTKDPAVSTGAYRSLGSVTDQGGAGGVSVDKTSIIVKYTYKGDTNLDGAVDINDLLNVAAHFNQPISFSPGGTGWLWQEGDFNNDGLVNAADLQYIGTNWLQGTGSVPGTQLSPLLTALGLPNVAVPEPTTLGMVGIGLTGLLARRRRRRS